MGENDGEHQAEAAGGPCGGDSREAEPEGCEWLLHGKQRKNILGREGSRDPRGTVLLGGLKGDTSSWRTVGAQQMCLPFPAPAPIPSGSAGAGRRLLWVSGAGLGCWPQLEGPRREAVPAGSGPSGWGPGSESLPSVCRGVGLQAQRVPPAPVPGRDFRVGVF